MRFNFSVKWFVCFVLLLSTFAFAITDDELGQMRNNMPDSPVVKPVWKRTMLVFSLCNGFKHKSIPYWKQALEIMGEKAGAFKVVHSDDMNVFTAESLKQFDVICFNNTTNLTPDEAQQKAIMDFIEGGKGIVGIHAATDNFYKWPEGQMMMGGTFTGHPWRGKGTWAVKLDDPDHPLMKSFDGQGFKINDEIYRTDAPLYSRDDQRVLMSLDMSDAMTKDAKGVTPEDMDTGISWVKSVGKGRLFYCSLGHNNHLTWYKPLLEHYLAGIQYAMGDLKVDDEPLGSLSSQRDTGKLNELIAKVKSYDWGDSRVALSELDAFIDENSGDVTTLGVIEGKLLSLLGDSGNLAVTDYACRKLSEIGTEQSVPALAEMLMDIKTTNQARYALERIEGKSVDVALVKAAERTSDKAIRVGIITTLGVRKSAVAMSVLGKFVSVGDEDSAEAAIRSLGAIGSEGAAEVLFKNEGRFNGFMKAQVQDAMLRCAESMGKSCQSDLALRIYRHLYGKGESSLIRSAALMGLVRCGQPESEDILKKALRGDDEVMQRGAAQVLAVVRDEGLLRSMASKIEGMPETSQVQVLAALAANDKRIGKEQVLSLIDSDNKAVKLAAYDALMTLGDVSLINVLAKNAAESQDVDGRGAAQKVLYGIAGRDVDSEILRKITAGIYGNYGEKETVELVKATVKRRSDGAVRVLLKVAMSDNRRISSESIRALQSLAGPEDMDEMVKLLVAKPGRATEDAVIVAGKKIEDRNDRGDLIVRKYRSERNEDVKVSMLRVMGRFGDDDSVSLIESEYASSNEKLSQASFRAMTDWPGAEFIEQMKELAKKSNDPKTKILALRGYARMIGLADDKSKSEVASELIAAYQMAERKDEQRLIIGLMGDCGNEKTLDFTVGMLDDPRLKGEAEVSAVKICEKMVSRRPELVGPVLKRIINTTSNKTLKKDAEKLLKKVKK
jgi:hypothetical protein